MNRLHVLVVEDSEDDVTLSMRSLRHAGEDPIYERVETPEAMYSALRERNRVHVYLPDDSSFAYLKTLPVDLLKIDGMFIKDVADDPIDPAMVKSINEIGNVMGKQTVAECVESDAILEKVSEIGIDFAQGYAIGRPVPIDELSRAEARYPLKRSLLGS